jgi:hypothetical protein
MTVGWLLSMAGMTVWRILRLLVHGMLIRGELIFTRLRLLRQKFRQLCEANRHANSVLLPMLQPFESRRGSAVAMRAESTGG